VVEIARAASVFCGLAMLVGFLDFTFLGLVMPIIAVLVVLAVHTSRVR
jgi:hypothetical protein